MSEFKHVTVIKKANIYFDGKVSSRTLQFSDGRTKTLGIMLPGEYTFNTADKELMEIQSGELQAKLPDQDDWQSYTGGQSFYVSANARFTAKVSTPVDYCCSFIAE